MYIYVLFCGCSSSSCCCCCSYAMNLSSFTNFLDFCCFGSKVHIVFSLHCAYDHLITIIICRFLLAFCIFGQKYEILSLLLTLFAFNFYMFSGFCLSFSGLLVSPLSNYSENIIVWFAIVEFAINIERKYLAE